MDAIPPWSDEAVELEPGSKYRHFKGDEYELLAVVRHSETAEELIVYQSLKYPDRIWGRPLKMFLEHVKRPELDYEGPRFIHLG